MDFSSGVTSGRPVPLKSTPRAPPNRDNMWRHDMWRHETWNSHNQAANCFLQDTPQFFDEEPWRHLTSWRSHLRGIKNNVLAQVCICACACTSLEIEPPDILTARNTMQSQSQHIGMQAAGTIGHHFFIQGLKSSGSNASYWHLRVSMHHTHRHTGRHTLSLFHYTHTHTATHTHSHTHTHTHRISESLSFTHSSISLSVFL